MTDVEAAAAGRRGAAMMTEFTRQPHPDLLSQAITEFSFAADQAMDSFARAQALRFLGMAHRQWYGFYGEEDALDHAVDALDAARALLTPEHPLWVYVLTSLGNALADRFDVSRSATDLSDAEAAFRQALLGMSTDHPDRGGAFVLLASVLRTRFDLSSDRRHLAEAGELCREAAQSPGDDDEAVASVYYQCSLTLTQLARVTDDVAAAREAEAIARKGIAAQPRIIATQAHLAAALGGALYAVGVLQDDLGVLDQARQALQDAVSITPESFALRAGFANDLAGIQHEMYRRTGDRAILDQAIEQIRFAAASASQHGVDGAGVLFTLGNLLHTRFGASNAPIDLDLAVSAYAAAVDGLGLEDPFRPEALVALGGVLENQCRRTQEPAARSELCQRAVDRVREAVGSRNIRDASKAMIFNNAASVLHFAFDETDEISILDEAQGLLRSIVPGEGAAVDHAGRLALNNLALALDADPRPGAKPVAEVESLLRRAVRATDPANVDYRQTVVNLAVFLRERFRATGSRAAWEEARALHDELIRRPSTMRGLIRNMVSVAELHVMVGDWRSAADAYQSAVASLPSAARIALGPSGRANGLSEFFALASDAAACALNCGDPVLALELLERGRGILLGQSVEGRALSSYVRRHASADQRDRFTHLIALLNSGSVTSTASSGDVSWLIDSSADTSDRIAAEEELHGLLAEVGYTSKAAPRISELIGRLNGSRVAVINISRHRCDALLVTAAGIEVVPLDRVTWDSALRQTTELVASIGAEAGRDLAVLEQHRPPDLASAVNDVLAWLWHAIAQPVLDAWGLVSSPLDGRWPRIWWCPTGPAAFLPIHAAGLHENLFDQRGHATSAATIDRAISSYALTITDLVDGIARPRPARRWPASALAVGIAASDQQQSLPGVDIELSGLASRIPGLRIVRDAAATRERVLSELANAEWFHFAGHGYQHPLYGQEGMLIPYDVLSAGPITADDVVATGTGAGELAYLSACDTSRGRFNLADESAHVAGAFKAAGFRHVVATAWSVRDVTAVQVTELFYDNLLRGSDEEAVALHGAVRECRRRFAQSHDASERLSGPLVWGPFMHFGP